jgi:hypothetical protein
MAKKTDVVRRSLFGSGAVDTREEEPRDLAKRSRGRNSIPQEVEVEHIGVHATTASRRSVERTAITVPTDLLMRVKDAVAVLNGWPYQYTMARFVEEAFATQLERLKTEHNGGREFPVTNRKIRAGRPPGS